MDEKIQDALNDQLNWELYSAYLYLSMAAYFESTGLRGFAKWMRAQSREELSHAMKIFDYINERGGRVSLSEIRKPPEEWNSAKEVFKDAYSHEKEITSRIHRLLEMARDGKDYATEIFLNWFVTEQVEEEMSVYEILGKIEQIGETPQGLFILDRELAKREE